VHQRLIIGVHLVLTDDQGRVLLGLRPSTAAFGADQWHVPAGHLEEESARQCGAREAAEELGITVRTDDLHLVHALHHLDADDGRGRIQLFFRVAHYDGPVENREPDRCTELRWWPPGDLPRNTVPYTAAALTAISAGHVYAEAGWTS
jgi:8-oxo-dGTP diphosphatase